MGLMSERNYKDYSSLFEVMAGYLQAPDLLIYLRAEVPTLVRQIQKRGREYESSIRIEYLERLNTLYEEWIESYDKEKLIIDTDRSEEHTSELQSRGHLVCRLLLEKKNKQTNNTHTT